MLLSWIFMTTPDIEHQILEELQAIRKLLEEIHKNTNVIAMRTSHRMIVGNQAVK